MLVAPPARSRPSAASEAAGRSAYYRPYTAGSFKHSLYFCTAQSLHWSALDIGRPFNPAIMTSTLARFRVAAPQLYLIAGASVGGLLFLRHVSSSLRADKLKTQLSPRESSLRGLSGDELNKLPYPPDALPGARDVDSPYGSIRVNEWGPEDGEQILLIHGISTPSIALADLAHKLVEKGCRVMLFGRAFPTLATTISCVYPKNPINITFHPYSIHTSAQLLL